MMELQHRGIRERRLANPLLRVLDKCNRKHIRRLNKILVGFKKD